MSEPKRRFARGLRDAAVRLARTSGRTRRGIGLPTPRDWIDARRGRRMDERPSARPEPREHDIPVSMPGEGDCRDDSTVETFLRPLESEPAWRTVSRTRAEANDAPARRVDGFHDPTRRHSAPNLVSPAQLERRAANQTAPH